MGLWLKQDDGSIVEVSGGGGGGDAGPHDHDYLPLTGGTVTGDLTVDGQLGFGQPDTGPVVKLWHDDTNIYGFGVNTNLVAFWAGGKQVGGFDGLGNLYLDGKVSGTDFQVGGEIVFGGDGAPGTISSLSGRSILELKPDSVSSPVFFLHGDNDASSDTMSIKDSAGGYMIRLHGGGMFQVFGDLKVGGDVFADFRIKSEYTRDNPTASGATNVHLSDNGYFYKTTLTRGGPFTPSKLARSEDVLVKAETATLPPEMETDDGGNILNTAEIEAHDTVQLFDVVTALLAKVKELSARIEELEGA